MNGRKAKQLRREAAVRWEKDPCYTPTLWVRIKRMVVWILVRFSGRRCRWADRGVLHQSYRSCKRYIEKSKEAYKNSRNRRK